MNSYCREFHPCNQKIEELAKCFYGDISGYITKIYKHTIYIFVAVVLRGVECFNNNSINYFVRK